jgi:phosphoglycolate phosphatase
MPTRRIVIGKIEGEAAIPTHAVLFDFDFTLGDSSPGIVKCVGHALTDLAFPVPPVSRILATVGLTLEETFRELTGRSDALIASRFTKLFHEHAEHVMEASTTIYEDAYPVLRKLRTAGIGTGIVSTKLHHRLQGIVRRNGLEECIGVIIGADDVTHPKPDPEGILVALKTLDVPPASAVYVGDHVVDAETAKNAGVSFVATLSGTCSRSSFDRYTCRGIVDNLGNLPKVLDAELSGSLNGQR